MAPIVLANAADSWSELAELLDTDLLHPEVETRVKQMWEPAAFDADQAVRKASLQLFPKPKTTGSAVEPLVSPAANLSAD